MSSPRYVPRAFCRPEDNFGRSSDVAWKDEAQLSSPETEQRGAAELQHHLCLAMRNAIAVSPGRVAEYAREANAAPERVGRMLRGELVMRLEDVANADRHLGDAIREAGWTGFPFGLPDRELAGKHE